MMDGLQYATQATSAAMMFFGAKDEWPNGPFLEEARESFDDRVRDDS
jgi:hypothetical protein